jgi:hypothetical protein
VRNFLGGKATQKVFFLKSEKQEGHQSIMTFGTNFIPQVSTLSPLKRFLGMESVFFSFCCNVVMPIKHFVKHQ